MPRSATSKTPKKLGGPRAFPAAIEGIVVRRAVALVAVMLAMLVVASGVALAAVFQGTAGHDVIIGTTLDDTIYGYGGNDLLHGSDPARVGSGKDNINGGTGNDVMSGELGPDSIAADWGDDWLTDGPAHDGMKDNLSAGPGADTIVSNNYPRATDAITCGTGIDKVLADSADTFLDRTNCEKVTIYNPPSAAKWDPTSPDDPSEGTWGASYASQQECPPDPNVPCEPDSRPRFR